MPEIRSLISEKERIRDRNPNGLLTRSQKDLLVRRYQYFKAHQYQGFAVDYDGTLTILHAPNEDTTAQIRALLTGLLYSKRIVAIMSGRGKSILEQISKFIPSESENRIYVCMYNGAKVLRGRTIILDRPFQKSLYNTIIRRIQKQKKQFAKLEAEIDYGRYSIRIRPFPGVDLNKILIRLRRSFKDLPVNIAISGESITITSKELNKSSALTAISRNCRISRPTFLKVGDQGHYRGNDYQLLNTSGSFSAGSISGSLSSCFPIISRDGSILKGPEAVLYLTSDLEGI